MSTLALMGAGPETASTFSPLSLTPTEWYDFSGTAGGGAAISSLADLSGNARTATQATGSKQPTSLTAAQNGLNGGNFDGVDDELLTGAFASTQPFVIYATLAPGVGAAGRYFSSGDAGWRAGVSSGVVGHDLFAGSALQPVFAGSTFTAWRQVTIVFNGASSIARSNGVQDGTGTVGVNNGATGVVLGSANAAQFCKCVLGEIFRVAGSSVSTTAEAYLKSKWATP